MGQTTSQIENYIDHTRADLGSNLQELEQKVKSATDWKCQFQKNPMTMLGAAFGGGVLMAAVLGGGNRRRRDDFRYAEPRPLSQHAGTERQKQKALETWDNVKGALIGAGAGAAAGTGVAYATGKEQAVVPAETTLTFTTR